MSMNRESARLRIAGKHRLASPARMRGVGLIEVMISVLVLAVGLLGIAAMQAMALRGGQSSLETSMAVMQTNALLEGMRADRAGAAGFNTAGMVCDTDADAGPPVGNDVNAWLRSLKVSITNDPDDTTTCVQVSGCPNDCEITVQWDDTRAGGESGRPLFTESRI